MLQNALSRARRVRRDEAGFTLIELLIVIIILGVLAAIVVFSVRGITDTGEESACEANYKTALTAIEAHYAQEDTYPANLAELVTDGFLADDPSASGDAAVDVTYGGGGASYTLSEGTACD